MRAEVRPDRDHPAQATRRVARNTAYLALADAAGKAMAFFYYLMAARHLGVERYGILSFALAFVTMLGVLTDLGLGTIITREVARDARGAQPQLNSALAIRLAASIAVIGLVAALANILRYPAATVRVVYICSAGVLANAVTTMYCSVFQGLERMELVALNRIAQTAVLVAGAAFLVRGAADVEKYALLGVVAGLVSVIVGGLSATPRLLRLGLSFDFGHWRKLLRASTPIGLATVFTMFYYWSGTTLLSKMSGNSAVGNYSAAYRLAAALVFVGMAFSGAVYPLFSRLFATDSARLVRVLELSTKYMTWIVLPAAAFGTVLTRPVVQALYGGGYQGASAVLRVLVWWGACASTNSLLSNYLISARRPGVVTLQTGLSLAVNLCLALVLIPVLGAVGAAVSLVAAEAGGLIYLVILLLRTPGHARVRPVAVNALRVLLALALAIPVTVAIVRWSAAVALVAGLALYCVLLPVVGAAGKANMRALRSLLRGGNE